MLLLSRGESLRSESTRSGLAHRGRRRLTLIVPSSQCTFPETCLRKEVCNDFRNGLPGCMITSLIQAKKTSLSEDTQFQEQEQQLKSADNKRETSISPTCHCQLIGSLVTFLYQPPVHSLTNKRLKQECWFAKVTMLILSVKASIIMSKRKLAFQDKNRKLAVDSHARKQAVIAMKIHQDQIQKILRSAR